MKRNLLVLCVCFSAFVSINGTEILSLQSVATADSTAQQPVITPLPCEVPPSDPIMASPVTVIKYALRRPPIKK